MAQRFVRQPETETGGEVLLAHWSDIVDNFTHVDLTIPEAFALAREGLGELDAREKVDRGISYTVDHPLGWNRAIKLIREVHGEEGLQRTLSFMKRKPEMVTRAVVGRSEKTPLHNFAEVFRDAVLEIALTLNDPMGPKPGSRQECFRTDRLMQAAVKMADRHRAMNANLGVDVWISSKVELATLIVDSPRGTEQEPFDYPCVLIVFTAYNREGIAKSCRPLMLLEGGQTVIGPETESR